MPNIYDSTGGSYGQSSTVAGGGGCFQTAYCCNAPSITIMTMVSSPESAPTFPSLTDLQSQVPGASPNERCTPVILDTSGKGFHLTNTTRGVYFDFFGIGEKIKIPWPAADSHNAWLVLDRNNNGIIDDGSELFGNVTPQPPSSNPNGYLALAQYDKPENGGNNDGVIDNHDSIFSSLRLWIDTNHNGVSDPGELYTLPELGVSVIELNFQTENRTDKNGNIFRFRSPVKSVPDSHVGKWSFDVVLVNTP